MATPKNGVWEFGGWGFSKAKTGRGGGIKAPTNACHQASLGTTKTKGDLVSRVGAAGLARKGTGDECREERDISKRAAVSGQKGNRTKNGQTGESFKKEVRFEKRNGTGGKPRRGFPWRPKKKIFLQQD